MKKRVDGYIYFYSEALGMECAMNNQTGDVWTEDKVKYTADEVRALGGYIDLNIHQVKKTMGGVICTPESQLD